MTLKSFIIASVIIHIVGGIALYFYYNPILLDEKPTPVEKAVLMEETVKKNLNGKDEEVSLEETNPPLAKVEEKKQKESTNQAVVELEAQGSNEESSMAKGGIEIIESHKRESLKQAQENLNKENEAQNLGKKIIDFSLLERKQGNPPLSYPVFARKLKMQGRVSVLFFVDERGLVDKLQLEKSSGHSDLDNFVLRALARQRFSENQTGWVRYDKTFVLKGEEKEYGRLRQEDSEFSNDKGLKSLEEVSGADSQEGEKAELDQNEEIINYESLEE